jgi:hypothetical protein
MINIFRVSDPKTQNQSGLWDQKYFDHFPDLTGLKKKKISLMKLLKIIMVFPESLVTYVL